MTSPVIAGPPDHKCSWQWPDRTSHSNNPDRTYSTHCPSTPHSPLCSTTDHFDSSRNHRACRGRRQCILVLFSVIKLYSSFLPTTYLLKLWFSFFVAQLVPCAGASGPWPCLLIPESTWISNRAHYAINNKLANGTKPLALVAKPKRDLAMHLGWQLKDKELLIKIITRLCCCRCFTLRSVLSVFSWAVVIWNRKNHSPNSRSRIGPHARYIYPFLWAHFNISKRQRATEQKKIKLEERNKNPKLKKSRLKTSTTVCENKLLTRERYVVFHVMV